MEDMTYEIKCKSKALAQEVRDDDPIDFYEFCECSLTIEFTGEALWILECLAITGDARQCSCDGKFAADSIAIQGFLVEMIYTERQADLDSERQAELDSLEDSKLRDWESFRSATYYRSVI